jgi:hypothetical protein
MTVSQVLRKFPALYGIGRFITVFTTARHLSLPWARSIQSTPSYPISVRFILILSSHISLSLPSGVFPLGFPNHHNLVCSSPTRAICPAHLNFLDLVLHLWWRPHIMNSFKTYITPLPCHLVPLSPKYLPQHPILKHPQPVFLPSWERPSSTPIQNQKRSYSSVYFNLYILR